MNGRIRIVHRVSGCMSVTQTVTLSTVTLTVTWTQARDTYTREPATLCCATEYPKKESASPSFTTGTDTSTLKVVTGGDTHKNIRQRLRKISFASISTAQLRLNLGSGEVL